MFEVEVRLYQQIPCFFLFVETAFLQLVQAPHVCSLCQFLFQGVELFDLLGSKKLEELVGNVKSQMGHFGCLELFILREILSLKDNVLNELNRFFCFNFFVLDVLFFNQVEMLSWGSNDVCKSLVKENEVQFRLDFFWMPFAECFSEFVGLKVILVGVFEISHFKVKFPEQQVIVVDFVGILEDILGNLDGSLYPLDGPVVLADFLEADRAVYHSVNQTTIIHVLFAYLYALLILLLSLFEELVFIEVISMFE